jgi:hypothetical protein
MGCAGRVANGINTVHLSYVRERTGHALIGAWQWIPAEHVNDRQSSAGMGLPAGLEFRTKGQLAIDVCTEAYADGLVFDFACGDEVYGNCTGLREFFERNGQAYVLRVASTFMLQLAAETRMTGAQAVKQLGRDTRRWEVRSAGAGSKGERWYAWMWIATASPRHYLLVRRHLRSKDSFGLDQCQARLHAAIARHTVLVMAALAVCAVAAARLKDRTDTQAPPPNRPDEAPPTEPGMIALTVPEIKRLLAGVVQQPKPPGHDTHWRNWRRRHQARARWFHQRARLNRDYALAR